MKYIGTGKQVGYTLNGQIVNIDPEESFIRYKDGGHIAMIGAGEDQRAATMNDLKPLYDIWEAGPSSNGYTQYTQIGVTPTGEGAAPSKLIVDATGQDVTQLPGYGKSWGLTDRGDGKGIVPTNIGKSFLDKAFSTILDPNTIINIGLNAIGGPAAVAAFSAIKGESPADIAKSAALAFAGNEIASSFGGSPSATTVPTEAPSLPSSFDQYLAPTPATTPLADIANAGATSFPVTPQTPFTGTSILDPVSGTPIQAIGGMGDNLPVNNIPQTDIPVQPTQIPNTDFSQPAVDVAQPAFDQNAVQPTQVPNTDFSTQPTTDMGGAQGIQAPTSSGTNLSDMGGGQGITAPVSANLPDMGGGQGLTIPAAVGGTLGATGVNTGFNLAGDLGSGLSAINTGVNQPTATTTGKSMSDILSNLTPAQLATLGQGLLSSIGGINTNSAISAGQAAQQAAAEKSLATLKDIYGTNLSSIAPYQKVGQAGVNQITENMPYFTHQFNAEDLATNLAPNYQFMLGQGQMANQRAANVGGGALSGNTLQGLQKYTQDYAGNAYQNAFNNYNTQRSGIYNTLANIAGMGSTANAQGIGAGNTYGTNVTNLNTGLAAAQAGANVAQAQNTSNTLSNIGNAATLATLLGQSNTVGSAAKDAASVINPYFGSIG